ncbi:MAG: glycoside hydrolase family 65 protein [Actinomycetota bacterium]|nr:glycoside hydrolase family 65 protein [Actinomycetota bacterium]
MKTRAPAHLALHRFPIDPWRLVEREHDSSDIGLTETLFAVANGYLGMRANPEEGRDAHSHGTYLNGFHETWHIQHAEDAYGFATTGQTIVNAPDAKVMKLYVDDEPLLVSTADLDEYERVLDFRDGTLTRDLVWRTPGGKRVRVRAQRLVSLAHRHLAILCFEVTLLDGNAPVVVSSQLLNRQDGEDEYHVASAALGRGLDPRKMRRFDHRVLVPRLNRECDGQVLLGYRCANSGMTMACGYRHLVDTTATHRIESTVGPDLAKTVLTARAEAGEAIRIVKFVTYHTSTGVPVEELADRCTRTLDRAMADGVERVFTEQREWLDAFWEGSDVELRGDDAGQQAVRWNLFQLAQASAQTQEHGIAAKGVTGGGYEGHYFWDTETYVVPFLAYTSPDTARKLLRWRWRTLPTARQRADTLHQVGALYPWRTINGEEASAYYAAGTAQYHINAAIAFALKRYLDASGDVDFLANEAAEILVETARLWEDLGFYGSNGTPSFRIHGVTGPDEYTTVVNDNLYTNVMARFNLRYAARVVELLREFDGEEFASLCRRVDLADGEIQRWIEASDSMYLPYDDELGIHPQDDSFLELEPWDFEQTPPESYPLLLHYHPLVIYRHQVLKQADVVLAMALRSDQFSLEQRRRNFDYYDPITTGDSSLSACVQAMAAAQIGYDDLAVEYFREALFVDLADTHGNAGDGVHVASAGGVWGTIAFGFAGLFDSGTALRFTPSLPSAWDGVTFRMQRHGSRMHVDLTHEGCTVTVVDGPPVPIDVSGDGAYEVVTVQPGGSQFIPAVHLP